MTMLAISAILGVVLGGIFTKLLFLQGVTLIFWGIAALAVGYFSVGRKASFINGAVFGFLLGFVFMVVDYNGSDPIWGKLPFFVILGVFSAVCGALFSFGGYWLKMRFKKG